MEKVLDKVMEELHSPAIIVGVWVTGKDLGAVIEEKIVNRTGDNFIGHAGDTVFFHSNLLIIPEEQVGLLVTCNSPGGSSLRNDLRAAFLDRYYPAEEAPQPPERETRKRIPVLEGTYESMIYNTSTIEKYFFPSFQYTIKATLNGTLMASVRGYSAEIEEVKPYTFRPVGGIQAFHGDQVFVRNSEGNVTQYYLAMHPLCLSNGFRFTQRPALLMR